MPAPSPENLADIILSRRRVYDLDTDSRIREASNRLTARALFEELSRLDDRTPDFPEVLARTLATLLGKGLDFLIGFDTGEFASAVDTPSLTEPDKPYCVYLRLVFRSEEAAFYQFHLFPDLDAPYVMSAGRKRAGAIQHLRLDLSHPGALDLFMKSCRHNPHLLRIEESTEEDFEQAPSNAI